MVEGPLPGMIDSMISRERLNVSTTLQAIESIGDEPLEDGAVLRANEFVLNTVDGKPILMVFAVDVLSRTAPPKVEVKEEPLSVKMEGTAEHEPKTASQTQLESKPSNHSNKENVAPYKTPAAKKMAQYTNTPGFTPPSTGRKSIQPIQALNPYNNLWTIKAKVTSKGPMRSLSRNGQSFNLFSICLVDQEGSEIEATLWRDLADQWHERIQDGKVYIISRGRVKPANKTYATTRNDYALDLSAETQIEECGEEDAGKMQVKVKYVRLDQLHSFAGKKMPVDILAVVKEVQPLGSVKRKSDGTDLPRRDLTLVDQSGKMARLTTWNSLAEDTAAELENLTYPVVSFTAIRVGDYDGVSLSTVSRTQMRINPEIPEAEDMRTWWESQGMSTEFVHAGAGLASARKSGDGRTDTRSWLSDVVKDQSMLPSPDAKPEYHNLRCTIMKIDPDQAPFFYAADAATGKKVVEDGSGWRFAADDTPCTAMHYRYFVRVSVMDATGSGDVVLSNDQAEKLISCKADDLREIRETDRTQFQALVQRQKFSEWNMTVKTTSREYRGELKQGIQVAGSLTQDFVAESTWLIGQIKALVAAA